MATFRAHYRPDRQRWEARVEPGRDELGKRRYIQKTTPKDKNTKREALRIGRQILNELEAGTYVEPTDAIVAEPLRSWHAEHARHHLSPRTHESYGYLLEAHIIPGLGGYKLAKLQPAHLQRYYSDRLDSGAAASSVRKEHNILHAAFKHAVMLRQMATNPADLVTPPRPKRTEMHFLTEIEAATTLRAAQGTSLHMALLLAIGTGMRRGEMLGLRWSDVDLDGAALTVNQTLQEAYGEIIFKEPKTTRSRRRITLPGVVVDALRVHRAEQAKKTLAREPGYVKSDLVLAAPGGGPWWPSNFDRVWRRFKTKQKLEIRFHDLRHTHATQLLKAGVNVKVISERLGHASIGITLDTYSHVMPGMQEEAAEKIDAGLRAALAG
jgi:integrase